LNWLLDTDVICQPAKRHGDTRVIAWLHQERDRCFTSAIVIAQLAYWVRSKEGRQRRDLQDWLRRLVDALGGRILGFNVPVAHVWADQEHLLEKHGQRVAFDGALLPPFLSDVCACAPGGPTSDSGLISESYFLAGPGSGSFGIELTAFAVTAAIPEPSA